MVIVIVGILAVIAMPKMFKTQTIANDSAAKANLEIISAALENYALHNNGEYPDDVGDLTGASPPYLNRPYCGETINGYSYSCTLSTTGYTITATPVSCGSSGTKNYTITTGGLLSEPDC